MRKSDNSRKPGAGRPFKKEGGSFKKSSGGPKREDRPSRPARGGNRSESADKGPRPFEKFRGKDSGDESKSSGRGKGFRKDSEREERKAPGKREAGFSRDKPAGTSRSDERPASSERGRGFRKDSDRDERKSPAKRGDNYGRDQFAGRGRSEERSGSSERGRGFRKDSDREERKSPAKREDNYGRDQFAGRGRSEGRSDSSERGKGAGRDSDRDEKRPFGKRERPESSGRRSFGKNSEKDERSTPIKKGSSYGTEAAPRKKGRAGREDSGDAKRVKFDEFEDGKVFSNTGSVKPDKKGRKPGKKPAPKQESADGMIRLNKYLSNAGVASRREADTLIESGAVKVNGVVVSTLGYKISPTDKVSYGDEAVRSERKVYLLLNKPKDYITTTDDPQERKTVMQLIAKACRERVYPVGRLDRNTTGLLLFTNDGDMTTKLTHPKFGIKKIYQVSLNKGLKPDDFKAIQEGIELEDGIVKADDLAFVGEGKKEIGIEIHSGRNRIVRRIFEHLGYDVLKLDRVVFAGLTKKDLPRGKYRFLTAKEIGFLQMIG